MDDIIRESKFRLQPQEDAILRQFEEVQLLREKNKRNY